MLHLVLLPFAFSLVAGAPLNSCQSQSECLRTESIAHLNDDGKYTICVWWDSELENCDKDGTISHICYGEEKDDKLEGWGSGQKQCYESVECSPIGGPLNYVKIGIKDGAGCNGASGEFDYFGFDGVQAVCGAGSEGGFCAAGKKKKDCLWSIPVPECEDDDECVTEEDCELGQECDDGKCVDPNTTPSPTEITPLCPDDPPNCIAYGVDLDDDGATCIACGCNYIGQDGCLGAPPQALTMRQDTYKTELDTKEVNDGENNNKGEPVDVMMFVYIGGGVLVLLLVIAVVFGAYFYKKSNYNKVKKHMDNVEMNANDGNMATQKIVGAEDDI